MIKGIHHISMSCCSAEQYEEEVKFYNEILGIPVKRTFSRGTMLDTGSGIIEIFNDGNDMPGEGVIRHFALAADDVDACIKAVSDAGYEVTVAPKDVVLNSDPVFPIRVAFCKGPLGEVIEFFHER